MVSKGATCSKRNRCCYRKRKWSRCGSFMSALLPNTFLPARWHKNLQFSREAETASTICVHRQKHCCHASQISLMTSSSHLMLPVCLAGGWFLTSDPIQKRCYTLLCVPSSFLMVLCLFLAPVAILNNIKHAPVIFFFLIVRHVKNNVTTEQH